MPKAGPSRVVITGIGLISPWGISIREHIMRIKSREKVLRKSEYAISNFVPEDHIEKLKDYARRMYPADHFSIFAAGKALKDAGIDVNPKLDNSIAVIMGSGFCELASREHYLKRVVNRNEIIPSPFIFPNTISNTISAYISIEYGLKGRNITLADSRYSGVSAVACAYDLINSGKAEIAVTGGAEELSDSLHKVIMALQKEPGDLLPLSEGASLLILENLESALKRNAPIYCEISDVNYKNCHVQPSRNLCLRDLSELEIVQQEWSFREIFGDMLGATPAFMIACAAALLRADQELAKETVSIAINDGSGYTISISLKSL